MAKPVQQKPARANGLLASTLESATRFLYWGLGAYLGFWTGVASAALHYPRDFTNGILRFGKALWNAASAYLEEGNRLTQQRTGGGAAAGTAAAGGGVPVSRHAVGSATPPAKVKKQG